MTNSERNTGARLCRRPAAAWALDAAVPNLLHFAQSPTLRLVCDTAALRGKVYFGVGYGLGHLLLGCIFAFLCAGSAWANVYATRVKLNGGVTNIVTGQGQTINISYLLNEPATLGATIDIKSGSVTVRSLVLTNGVPGTLRGTNVVVWDGKDSNSNAVAGGTYTVSITPKTSGYGSWTQINSNTNSIWGPQGIAVNRNTNSPYYGRVYVANAETGPNPDFSPGDAVGIVKFNADGTFAEEGPASTGGWPWPGDSITPWKVEVGDDARVYVSDMTGTGDVLSFDPLISSNSWRLVFRADNASGSPGMFSGPFVSATGSNAPFWMANTNSGGSGVRRWLFGGGGVLATNDTGVTAVQTGLGSDLNSHPNDMALDQSNRIYVVQNITASGDVSPRVMRFPAYTGTALTTADWKVGSGDDSMAGACGVSVNPSGSYVAVAFQGLFDGFGHVNGATRILSAAAGTNVATVQPVSHEIRDVAWDNAGNVYATDGSDSLWRVYSPPGTNQVTTVALASIQVTNPPGPPLLSQPVYDGSLLRFNLSGEPNVTYVILDSTNLINWFPVTTNTSVFAVRPIAVPAPGAFRFFRARLAQ